MSAANYRPQHVVADVPRNPDPAPLGRISWTRLRPADQDGTACRCLTGVDMLISQPHSDKLQAESHRPTRTKPRAYIPALAERFADPPMVLLG